MRIKIIVSTCLSCVVTACSALPAEPAKYFGLSQALNPEQLIPEEYEYNAVGDPCYVSSDEAQKLQERTEVRLRIVGTKMDQTEIVSFCMWLGRHECIDLWELEQPCHLHLLTPLLGVRLAMK